MKTITPEKQSKINTIEQIANAIGDHFAINPKRMFFEGQLRKQKECHARALFIYHLYISGMSLDAIGRMMRKSPELVRCDKLKGELLADDHREMMDSLPVIPRSAVTKS